MRGKPPQRLTYSVACTCGATQRLDARAFGRPRVCTSCGGSFTVAWGRAKGSRRTVPVVVSHAPARAAAPRGGSPYTAFCGCGYSRPVPAAQAHDTPKCPGCGKLMVVEKAPDPKDLRRIHKSERPKPSAPLLPLHLRPPGRVRLKPGAQFFDCPCGERLLLRAGSPGRPLQCPACDRFHIVEIEEAPPPEAPAADAGRPAGLKAPPRELRLGEFQCECGEIQPPRTSRTGREFTCAACGRKGRVEASVDPATQKTTMKAVILSGPTREKAAPPSPVGAWTCACGGAIDPQPVLAGERVSCPACGRPVGLEKSRQANTSMTMIRPVFGQAPPPRPAETPAEPVLFQELDAPPPVVGEPDGAEFQEIPDDAQSAICECGAELLVSPADVGAHLQCPGCRSLLTAERTVDPLGGPAGLRVRMLGRLDDEGWTLEEFK